MGSFRWCPKSMFLDELVISDSVLLIGTVNLAQRSFFLPFDPLLLEILLRYIILLFSITSSTCLLSSLVLEFLFLFPQLSYFLGIKVAQNTVQRSSPH